MLIYLLECGNYHIYWNMASYLLKYITIFIGICYLISWNMLSHLLEYVTIFIGICHYIHWNMSSYLLEYVIIFIGICHHIYWIMTSYLLDYVIIFIGLCHRIYLMLNSNSDKNYIQNITSVKFLWGISTYRKKTLINKRKTSELFNIHEFCFIISLYSYGLIFFLPVNLKHYVPICLYIFKNIIATYIYIYIFRQLNVNILKSSTYPMTIYRYNARVKLSKFKILSLENNARTRRMWTLSAIFIHFTKE